MLWKLYISKYNLLGLWHNSVFQSIPDWSCWQYNSCTASCGLHRNTNCNNKHCSYWMVDCVTDDTACDSALLPKKEEEDKIPSVSYCLCNRNVYMISIVMTSWITVILSMNLAPFQCMRNYHITRWCKSHVLRLNVEWNRWFVCAIFLFGWLVRLLHPLTLFHQTTVIFYRCMLNSNIFSLILSKGEPMHGKPCLWWYGVWY